MAQTHTTPVMERVAAKRGLTALMVHVRPDERSTHRVKMAARLARDFDALLIGIGAELFEPVATFDPYGIAPSGEWMAEAQRQVVRDLAAAEQAFRRDAAGARAEWCAIEDQPARVLAAMSRRADLIVADGAVTGAGRRNSAAGPGDLIMTCGRPVLIVPAQAQPLEARKVVVAWKDTRESRRAVADAMPFLLGADEVVVVGVCAKDAEVLAREGVDDVVAHLSRSGAKARGKVVVEPAGTTSEAILAAARDSGADLIVAGAYGHSRFREWVLGGVTDDLLHDPTHYLLLSH